MKKILCYGDSNTYGFMPAIGTRYLKNNRWTGILSAILKDKYIVVKEGLNNRNGFVKNPLGKQYCAMEDLPSCLSKNQNIDIVVLAVGTNDVQFLYKYNEDIAKNGILKLIDIIKKYNNFTKVIIIPPVKIDKTVSVGCFNNQFNDESVKRMERTFYLYKKLAIQTNCYYFDFNEFVSPSDKDGLHYEKKEHSIIAKELSKYIKYIEKT